MGFSALAGGIATGFLTSQRERTAAESEAAKIAAQREEARLGRESREGIAAANRLSSEKMAQKTLEATVNRTQQNREQTLGANAYDLLVNNAKYMGEMPATLLSEKMRDALKVTHGIVPENREDGISIYNLSPIKLSLDSDRTDQVRKKIAVNILDGKANPSLYSDNPKVIEEVFNIQGIGGNTKKAKVKQDKLIQRLTKKFELEKSTERRINWLRANPKPKPLPFQNKQTGKTDFIKLPNKADIIESSSIFANYDPTSLAKTLASSEDNRLFRFTRLEVFDTMLRDAIVENNIEKINVLKKHIITNLRGDYNSVGKALAEKGINYIDSEGKNVDLTELDIAEAVPDIYNLFIGEKKSNVNITKTKKMPSQSIDDQSKILAKNKNISVDEAKALLLDPNSDIAVINTGGMSLGSSNKTARVNPKQNKSMVKIVENPQNSVKVTVKPVNEGENAPTNVSAKANVSVDVNGNEEVIKFKNPLTMTDARINKLMYFDDLVKADPEYFNNPKRVDQKAEYERIKVIYGPIDDFMKTPTTDNLNNAKAVIQQVFNFEDRDGKVSPDVLEDAVRKLAGKQSWDKLTPAPSEVTLNNGRTMVKSFKPVHYSEEEINKIPSLSKKITDLRAKVVKLEETKENISSFKNNQGKLKATETLLKKLTNNQNIDVGKVEVLFELLKSDPNFSQNKELQKELKVQSQRMGQRGFNIGTDAAANTVGFFQRIKDYIKAIPIGLNQITPDFVTKEFGFNAASFTSDNDTSNDGSTRFRLREVEQWAASKSKQYNNTITAATESATQSLEKAANATNSEEKAKHMRAALQQKVIAYQAYLLAQNALTKVSMTYTYAGMVQGQSGGRAISNEDFAILYRAIWGGAGGPTAEGSFDRIEDIVKFLGARAENDFKYAKIKYGSEVAQTMLGIDRAIAKEKFKRLYEEAANFSLLKHEEGQQPTQSISSTVSFPANLITNLDGNKTRLDTANLKTESTRFSNTFSQVMKVLPPRKKGAATQYGEFKVGSKILSFNELDKEEKDNVGTKGVSVLRLLGNNSNIVSKLNRYQQGNLKLGDVLNRANRRLEQETIMNTTTDPIRKKQAEENFKKLNENSKSEKKFIIDLIAHLYNSKR